MNNRIDERFSRLAGENRKALIPFFMPGAVRDAETAETIWNLEKSGADLIELGIPFSDPIADGPVIQRSAAFALGKGVTTKDVLEGVKKARGKTDIPLLLLVYYNSVFKYGNRAFAEDCASAGVDGLIIPDLPKEEQDELKSVIADLPVRLITMAARTSGDRLKAVLKDAEGFVYCVSAVGVTGERGELYAGLPEFLAQVRAHTELPRCVGFGIATPGAAANAAKAAEGAIVGSALVRRFLEEGQEAGLELVRQMRKALDADKIDE